MLISIVGPDRVGKTTLFESLKRESHLFKFVGGLPVDPVLMPYMQHVEAHYFHMWEQLYEPSRVYITDRSSFLDALVYSEMYGRPLPHFDCAWMDCSRFILLDAPTEVLQARGDPIEKDFGKARELYRKHTSVYQRSVIDATQNLSAIRRDALSAIGRFVTS